MNRKKKGIDAERELIKLLWEHSWACIRSAGSGSMHYPSPDILASNNKRIIAIESKVSSNNRKYFSKDEIKQLYNFCEYFGCEKWIAVKFGKEWFFLNPEDLKSTNKGFSITKEQCNLLGLSLKELIN